MKMLVQTKPAKKGDAPFMLIDPTNGTEIQEYRPTVVKGSSFVTQRMGIGQIEVLANDLPDSAEDSKFAEEWAKDPKGVTAKYTNMGKKTGVENPNDKK